MRPVVSNQGVPERSLCERDSLVEYVVRPVVSSQAESLKYPRGGGQSPVDYDVRPVFSSEDESLEASLA